MKLGRLTWVLVAAPILITFLALGGRLLIESEANKFQAELDRCIVKKDRSQRCRLLICFAEADDDGGRADCIEQFGPSAGTSTAS